MHNYNKHIGKTAKKQFFDVKKCNMSGITNTSITLTTTTNTTNHGITKKSNNQMNTTCINTATITHQL